MPSASIADLLSGRHYALAARGIFSARHHARDDHERANLYSHVRDMIRHARAHHWRGFFYPFPSDSPSGYFRRFLTVRERLPRNAVLGMRMGDFWEFFAGDAQKVAHACGLPLTQRNGLAMAGFPVADLDKHKTAINAAGFSLALAETDSTWSEAKERFRLRHD